MQPVRLSLHTLPSLPCSPVLQHLIPRTRLDHGRPWPLCAAFDAVLFDRGQPLPHIIDCYKLAESDHILRFYAIQLLGFSGSSNAVDTLVFALNDPEPLVRAEACRSLEDIGLIHCRYPLLTLFLGQLKGVLGYPPRAAP